MSIGVVQARFLTDYYLMHNHDRLMYKYILPLVCDIALCVLVEHGYSLIGLSNCSVYSSLPWLQLAWFVILFCVF